MEIFNVNGGTVICGSYPSPEVHKAIYDLYGPNAFNCITFDPPYGNIVKKSWDKISEKKALDIYMETAISILESDLKQNGTIGAWFGVGKPGCRPGFKFLLKLEEELDSEIIDLITWRKKRAYGKKKNYLFIREELAIIKRKNDDYTFNIPLLDEKRGYAGYNVKYPAKSEFKRRTNVWSDITELFRNKTHECEKPERLYEVIYETHSNPGDLVLDIFAGSGAAASAARNIGRKFCVIEQNLQDVQQIIKRLS